MHDLIKIQPQNIGGQTIETVNARELHSFLEVGKVFASWIKDRIEQYGFIDSLDYVVIPNFGNNPLGGRSSKECAFDSPELGNQTSGRGGDRRSIEYHISLDMAKELAMVENNEQGRIGTLASLMRF